MLANFRLSDYHENAHKANCTEFTCNSTQDYFRLHVSSVDEAGQILKKWLNENNYKGPCSNTLSHPGATNENQKMYILLFQISTIRFTSK